MVYSDHYSAAWLPEVCNAFRHNLLLTPGAYLWCHFQAEEEGPKYHFPRNPRTFHSPLRGNRQHAFFAFKLLSRGIDRRPAVATAAAAFRRPFTVSGLIYLITCHITIWPDRSLVPPIIRQVLSSLTFGPPIARMCF